MIKTGRYDEAIDILTHVLAEDPSHLPALLNIGIAYTENGDNEKAIEALRFYIKHDEENDEAWEALGCAYLRRKQYERAESSFKRAIDVNPENASVLRNYSVLLSQTDRNRGSYRMLRRSPALNPNDYLTTFALAAAYRYLGRRDEALELYEKLNQISKLPESVRRDIEHAIIELSVGW
jgi:tetratricopeptide (TPR) repeat protein